MCRIQSVKVGRVVGGKPARSRLQLAESSVSVWEGRWARPFRLENRSLWRHVYLMDEDIVVRVESVEECITMDARELVIGTWRPES